MENSYSIPSSQIIIQEFDNGNTHIFLFGRFGIPQSKLSFYRNTAETLAEYGLQSSARKSKHRALGVSVIMKLLILYRIEIPTTEIS